MSRAARPQDVAPLPHHARLTFLAEVTPRYHLAEANGYCGVEEQPAAGRNQPATGAALTGKLVEREYVMRKALNLVVFMLSAVAGAWVGYWIGDALGWSKNAEFPWRFGGGTGAALLAFAMSVVFVGCAYVVLLYLPGRKVRQALENGVPARARVVSIETTGEQSATKDGTYDRVRCELEVRPRGEAPYRAQVLQFLTPGYVEGLGPDSVVQVRYDPSQRTRVAIIEPDLRRR